MSSEESVKQHVENELEVAKHSCRVWKVQMANVYFYMSKQGAIGEEVKAVYDKNNSVFDSVIDEDDVYDIKRATVCMNILAEALFDQWNKLINYKIATVLFTNNF